VSSLRSNVLAQTWWSLPSNLRAKLAARDFTLAAFPAGVLEQLVQRYPAIVSVLRAPVR
jgi:hypothetical protein